MRRTVIDDERKRTTRFSSQALVELNEHRSIDAALVLIMKRPPFETIAEGDVSSSFWRAVARVRLRPFDATPAGPLDPGQTMKIASGMPWQVKVLAWAATVGMQ